MAKAEITAAETAAAETAAEKQKKAGWKSVYIRKPAEERNVKARVVGVNGKMYTVPYDKEVEVPPEVAEVLEMSNLAQKIADEEYEQVGSKITEL